MRSTPLTPRPISRPATSTSPIRRDSRFAVPFVNTHVGEGTATFAYNLTDQFQTRFEFREDYANRPLFLKGGSKFEETQPILEVGFIYTFSSMNAKW